MRPFKINVASPPAFVLVQEFTKGVLGYWITLYTGDIVKISDGDFVLTDDKLRPVQYIPSAQSSDPNVFQDYKDAVGKQLLTDIWKTLNAAALTDSVKASILQTISSVQIACIAGEIRVARDIANTTATTANFTAARKTALLNIIDAAINTYL